MCAIMGNQYYLFKYTTSPRNRGQSILDLTRVLFGRVLLDTSNHYYSLLIADDEVLLSSHPPIPTDWGKLAC